MPAHRETSLLWTWRSRNGRHFCLFVLLLHLLLLLAPLLLRLPLPLLPPGLPALSLLELVPLKLPGVCSYQPEGGRSANTLAVRGTKVFPKTEEDE